MASNTRAVRKTSTRSKVVTSKSKRKGWIANHMGWLVALLFVVVFGGLGSYFVWFSHADKPTEVAAFAPDQLLVSFRPGVTDAQQGQTMGRYGLKIKTDLPQIGTKVLSVNPKALEAVQQALSHNPAVEFVEKDYASTAAAVPNDPCFPAPNSDYASCYAGEYNSKQINAAQAWDISTGSSNVVIAVGDCGVAQHPDLVPHMVGGWNVLTNTTDTSDACGHGTEVAGAAAATGNNGIGIAGACPSCSLMPVKFATTGTANDSDIANANIWAADHGAKVINVSWGGTSYSSALCNSVSYARNKGVVFVAAAGNFGSSAVAYPAGCPGAIGVAAVDQSDNLDSYSEYGSWVKIAAPTGQTTTLPTGAYGPVGGTSLAAPLVAGAAGAAFAAHPGITSAQVEQALTSTAYPCCSSKIGGGRLDYLKVLQSVTGTLPPADTTPPTIGITYPTSGTTVAGGAAVTVNAVDNVGVKWVQFYLDGTYYANDSAAPYGWYLNTVNFSNGNHTLMAKVTDTSGNVASSSVTFTINNATVADTTPPTTSISSPVNGATVNGTTGVAASASDNVGVSSTELYIDGLLRASATTANVSFNWDTTQETNGTHTIMSKAYDAAGNVGSSSTVTVTVNNQAAQTDTTPPVVTISVPASGSAIAGVVPVSGSATDNVGVIKMELLFDGKLQTTSTNSSISGNWNTKRLKSGTHTITINAYDTAGNKGTTTEQVIK